MLDSFLFTFSLRLSETIWVHNHNVLFTPPNLKKVRFVVIFQVAESNESASRSSVLPDGLVSEKGDMPDYFVFPKEQKLWPSKSSLGEFYQPQTHASKHVFEVKWNKKLFGSLICYIVIV